MSSKRPQDSPAQRPEDDSEKKPMRQRLADRWNGLGAPAKSVAVVIGVAVAVAGSLVAVAYSRADSDDEVDEDNASTRPLSFDEQEQLVVTLCTSLETMTEEEFEANYAKLDRDHQFEVDESISAFAAAAVGDENWDL
ncbi:hypothetical protein [Streptomyces sp. NPDC014006]|uniref:hypothetical protein n=1 Tax=Streptomyces sp. NPDC014006 TaxID=3364870 RepID=UPI0037001623